MAGTGSAETDIGKVGLGDLEIDDEGETLFAVNLFDRRIYRLDRQGAIRGSFRHGASDEPWAQNARPFGLGYRDGWLYHGVVDSRERPGLPGYLSAHVYRSRGDGSDTTEVAAFALDYDRPEDLRWEPWSDSFREDGRWRWANSEPLLVDIEFRDNGDLILGLGDRKEMSSFDTTHGDVLPSTLVAPGRWQVITEPEHYPDDVIGRWDGGRRHEESLQGQLAAMRRFDRVVTMAEHDPPQGGGGWWFDNETGRVAGPVDGIEGLFKEEMFAGDLEALCDREADGPSRHAVYLPIATNRACLRPQAIDVVLVVDMSTSMRSGTGSGTLKHEAAVEAATEFARMLQPAAPDRVADRAAVVGFNGTAWIEQELTTDRASTMEALRQLEGKIAEGTRLDLALHMARVALQTADADSSAARLPRLAVVILLTDGMPNRVPPADDGQVNTTVLRSADSVKTLGARLFTVGFGTHGDLDEGLLRSIATDPTDYAFAPTPDDLIAIYAELAHSARCW